MHQFLLIICFCITLYMFRTVFPSIIRSSELYIQQQAYKYVKQIRLPSSPLAGTKVDGQATDGNMAHALCMLDTYG
jgi:hypothetical protein